MKNWTKKFLKRNISNKPVVSYTKNAVGAKKQVGVPEKLWCEISDGLPNTELLTSIRGLPEVVEGYNTAFMAGFTCGWAEKSRKVK
jgi:hypothetical protein